VADVDLAVILGDGEFLQRVGDELVGAIPAGGAGGGLDAEGAVDATAAALAAGTHTNVTVTYNDTANAISLAAPGAGTAGPAGPAGPPGPGVPAGGAAGTILAKTTAADYATGWITAPTGGGGAAIAYTGNAAVSHAGYTAGLLYANNLRSTSPLNQTAGRCHFVPVVFAHTTTIKTLGLRMGGSGPAEMRFWLGIYADNGSTSPGTRVAATELVLAAGAPIGTKTVTGLTIPVTAGQLYWLSLTPNTSQNGSAGWWFVINPPDLYARGEDNEVLYQQTGYVQPPATAAAAADQGWGAPYLLYGV
jgi:hypothetical protein